MRWAALGELIRQKAEAVLVEVSRTRGSTPREEGAWMLVTPGGGYKNTIGGGALEWRALAEAQAMLEHGENSRTITQSLGPDLGQCCGGHVTLTLTRYTKADLTQIETRTEADTRRPLYIFGAGHVGRALILAFAPLPFRISWIDTRPDVFPAHLPANVAATGADPEAVMAQAEPGSFVLILTHSHPLDLALTAAALKNPQIAYLGLIGSATKKARFLSRLTDAGMGEEARARVVCPIGLPGLGSKLPAAIAASVAADLLIRDERLKIMHSPLTARAGTA
jgi:xanthine dehydrogenase accessory factor